MSTCAENIKRLQARIEAVARRCGRQPEEIRLVAVTKGVEAAQVREAASAGVREIGENYIQEALPKLQELAGPPLVCHFIGHLQRNKAGRAVAAFDSIQSIDSAALAEAVGRHARASGREIEALVEVNVAGEACKSGVAPEAALDLAAIAAQTPGLRLGGLMGIAPLEGDADAARAAFRRLRALFEGLPEANRRILSMGMTGDFEVAIEEGSTMIRIGTGIFGQRRTHPHE
jgi:pyridoxal phosphate enzyme (YggS family)